MFTEALYMIAKSREKYIYPTVEISINMVVCMNKYDDDIKLYFWIRGDQTLVSKVKKAI